MVSFATRRRFFALPTLLLAVVFAFAPVAAQHLMVSGMKTSVALDQWGDDILCPTHGNVAPQAFTSGKDSPATGGRDVDCYCSVVCHATFAISNITLPDVPCGLALQTDASGFAAHTFEPSPLPRPPKN